VRRWQGRRAGVVGYARALGLEPILLSVGDDLATVVDDDAARGADALGVDRGDLGGPLDAFIGGVERRIDVAEVNGRLFLTNVSLGIYGHAHRGPVYRDARARTLPATAALALGPSACAAAVDLELEDDRGRRHRDPVVVPLSNNPYSLGPRRAPATRSTLDGDRLGFLVLDLPRARRSPGRAWTATRFEVNTAALVHGGVDGDAVDLTPPLRFAIGPTRSRSGPPPVTRSEGRTTEPADLAVGGLRSPGGVASRQETWSFSFSFPTRSSTPVFTSVLRSSRSVRRASRAAA
jgi:hypothetical protein